MLMVPPVVMMREDQVESDSQENSRYQHYPGSDRGYPEWLIKYDGYYGKRNEDPAERQIDDAVYDYDCHQNSYHKSPGADIRKHRR